MMNKTESRLAKRLGRASRRHCVARWRRRLRTLSFYPGNPFAPLTLPNPLALRPSLVTLVPVSRSLSIVRPYTLSRLGTTLANGALLSPSLAYRRPQRPWFVRHGFATGRQRRRRRRRSSSSSLSLPGWRCCADDRAAAVTRRTRHGVPFHGL